MTKFNRLFGIFFCSGFAALAYQIYFAKKLSLVFGSQSSATYTVLAIYMAGMALGSGAGTLVAKRTKNPIRLYAITELIVALYCLCTPAIFSFAHDLYVSAAAGYRPDAQQLVVYQILLGSLVLSIPTILMGVTFPLLVRAASHEKSCLASIAWLYSANTFGAASGALLAGYLLIPALGMAGTLWLSAALDVIVAMVAFHVAWRMPETAASTESVNASFNHSRRPFFGLVVLFVVGAITMMMEVSTMHLLAVVVGNSVYAFSSMLTCFLVGLALGGRYAGRNSSTNCSADQQMINALSLLSITILCSTFLWSISSVYFSLLSKISIPHSFWFREILRAIPAVAITIPPAFAIGALYPISMTVASRGKHDAIGFPSAVNTIGNIAGVLLAGFVLLPAIGGFRITVLCGLVAFVLLLVAVWCACDIASPIQRYGSAAVATVMALVCPKQLDHSIIATGTNTYFRSTYYANWRIIDHAESADGGLTAVMALADTSDGIEKKTLTTNGKFQGNNVMVPNGEMQAQVGFGLLPILHVSDYDRALVIGYGTGITSMAILESGFKHLDIVDLSKDLVSMSDRHFSDINHQVGTRPGVSFYYTDGRNYLALTRQRYDLIAIQLSSIWFAGAASVYNREFYALASAKLNEDGIIKQWFQLRHMGKRDLSTIVSSLAHSFRYVWVYSVGGQGTIIASNSRRAYPDIPKKAKLLAMGDNKTMRPYIALYPNRIQSIATSLLLDPEQVKRMIVATKSPISDDDNLVLEYSTPKGNALEDSEFSDNIDYLKKYARSE